MSEINPTKGELLRGAARYEAEANEFESYGDLEKAAYKRMLASEKGKLAAEWSMWKYLCALLNVPVLAIAVLCTALSFSIFSYFQFFDKASPDAVIVSVVTGLGTYLHFRRQRTWW